jgi:hypothetical protein
LLEEVENDVAVEVRDGESARLTLRPFGDVPNEQAKCVPVALDGRGTGIALFDESASKK